MRAYLYGRARPFSDAPDMFVAIIAFSREKFLVIYEIGTGEGAFFNTVRRNEDPFKASCLRQCRCKRIPRRQRYVFHAPFRPAHRYSRLLRSRCFFPG